MANFIGKPDMSNFSCRYMIQLTGGIIFLNNVCSVLKEEATYTGQRTCPESCNHLGVTCY